MCKYTCIMFVCQFHYIRVPTFHIFDTFDRHVCEPTLLRQNTLGFNKMFNGYMKMMYTHMIHLTTYIHMYIIISNVMYIVVL